MSPEDVAKILDELGARIGPYGQEAWWILIRQKILEGVVWAIGSGLFLIALTVGFFIALSITRRLWAADVAAYAKGKGRWSNIQNHPDKDGYFMAWLFVGTFGGFAWIAAAVGFIHSVLQALNPQYYAIQDLLGVLGK